MYPICCVMDYLEQPDLAWTSEILEILCNLENLLWLRYRKRFWLFSNSAHFSTTDPAAFTIVHTRHKVAYQSLFNTIKETYHCIMKTFALFSNKHMPIIHKFVWKFPLWKIHSVWKDHFSTDNTILEQRAVALVCLCHICVCSNCGACMYE